jgi:hypothetical protein
MGLGVLICWPEDGVHRQAQCSHLVLASKKREAEDRVRIMPCEK